MITLAIYVNGRERTVGIDQGSASCVFSSLIRCAASTSYARYMSTLAGLISIVLYAINETNNPL